IFAFESQHHMTKQLTLVISLILLISLSFQSENEVCVGSGQDIQPLLRSQQNKECLTSECYINCGQLLLEDEKIKNNNKLIKAAESIYKAFHVPKDLCEKVCRRKSRGLGGTKSKAYKNECNCLK